MKKILIALLIFCSSPLSVSAQYDDDFYMMLDLMRSASSYDHKLWEVMAPVIKDISYKYSNGQYYDCIKAVNFTFDNVTFYKRNYYIYSWLYYFRGMSYLKLNYEETGILNLVSAKDAQNEEARKALEELFVDHMGKAISDLSNNYYGGCIKHVNWAKSTTFYNYQLYEVEGKALEGMLRFDDAKKSYRLAKKYGSPNARTLMKQLKTHKREYMKK